MLQDTRFFFYFHTTARCTQNRFAYASIFVDGWMRCQISLQWRSSLDSMYLRGGILVENISSSFYLNTTTQFHVSHLSITPIPIPALLLCCLQDQLKCLLELHTFSVYLLLAWLFSSEHVLEVRIPPVLPSCLSSGSFLPSPLGLGCCPGDGPGALVAVQG